MREHEAMNPVARLAEVSEMWMSAWLKPLSALNVWNEYWRDHWKSWLAGRAAGPAAWLPALAEERFDQPDAINFFLPWLPRVDALVVPLDAPGEDEAMRLMLRAALPRVGAFGPAEWLTVDATIRHSAGAQPPQLPAEAAPAVLDAPPPAPAKRPRATLRRADAVTKAAKGAQTVQAGATEAAVAAPAPAATAEGSARQASVPATPAPAKTASAKAAPVKRSSVKALPAKTESAKPVAAKPVAAKAEVAKAEAAKPEVVKAEPAKAELAKAELAKTAAAVGRKAASRKPAAGKGAKGA